MATVLHSGKECIKTNLISLEEFLTLWKVHYSTLSKSSTKGNKASSRNKTIFGITQWTLADRSGHLSWYHTMNPKGRKKNKGPQLTYKRAKRQWLTNIFTSSSTSLWSFFPFSKKQPYFSKVDAFIIPNPQLMNRVIHRFWSKQKRLGA